MTEIAMPEPAAPKAAPKTSTASPWRDNIEAMLMAIIMAIVLKYFIVEAYRIPTGSMQPTLMGNDKVGVYDRILVDKFSYQFRDPERFEVAVFRYPLDRSKNYVKRIVGVGPEYFRVFNGDLWHRATEDDAWAIARRPEHVEMETWLKLYMDDAEQNVFFDTVKANWSVGRDFELEGARRIRFGASQGSIMDAYNDGYPDAIKNKIPRNQRGSGEHPLGDLRIDGTLTVDANVKWVAFEMREGALAYDFRLPGPAAPSDAAPQIRLRDLGKLVEINTDQTSGIEFEKAAEPMRLEAGVAYDFNAQNFDDVLSLKLDGELLCSAPVASNPNQASALYIETSSGQVAFQDVMVYRDIYYTNDNALVDQVFIPDGNYFMMGDNTLDSADSRMWQEHRIEHLLPNGEVELVIGNHRQGNGMASQSDFTNDINPLTSAISDLENGPITWFRDEWGELHHYLPSEFQSAKPMTQPAPFVRRDQILGRAISVFWPIRPFDGILRVKMVD